MTLTSNETAWATMIVTLFISLAYGTVLTWITIRAQHAKRIEDAIHDIKNIFVRLFVLLSVIAASFLLIYEITRTSPITRLEVFVIVLCVCILLISFLYYVVCVLLKMIMRTTDFAVNHVEVTKQIAETLGTVAKAKRLTRKMHRPEDRR